MLFTKAGQSVNSDTEDSEDEEGIFTRRQECRDVYEGMEVIASIYGFSGIEPNTTLMGWASNTKEPKNFARLIKSFNNLDYNSLFLHYNDEVGFGKRKRIDIWWRGAGNNFSLSLTLARFITSNDDWRNAEIRLLTIKDDLSSVRVLENEAHRVLRTFRIDAVIKIIDNTSGEKSIGEIFKEESQSADLSIFGIPPIDEKNAEEYIRNLNKLLIEVGTTLLVNASSYFKEIKSAEQE
ncbi:hypothetical protein ACFLSS_02980 [Bacteroidota bacterium]